MTKQFERHEDTYGNVTHITRDYKENGSTETYEDKMLKSDEEEYLKDQKEKGYRD